MRLSWAQVPPVSRPRFISDDFGVAASYSKTVSHGHGGSPIFTAGVGGEEFLGSLKAQALKYGADIGRGHGIDAH